MPLCPVDGAPGDQGQEEGHEAAVRAGGAAAPEHDGEDVGDLEQQARERPVRVLRERPEQPTAADVQEHEISGHETFRSWCRACVAGRGGADAHVGRPGVEHRRRQMRHKMRLQARTRQMEFEPRRQCIVEGAAWIGGSLVMVNERNRAVLAKELQGGRAQRWRAGVVGTREGSSCDDHGGRCPDRISTQAGEEGAESREWACGRCSQRAQGDDSYLEAQHRDGSWEANLGDS